MISQPTSSWIRLFGDDDVEHRGGEQRQHHVEPGEPHVAVHVAERVDVHAERDRA